MWLVQELATASNFQVQNTDVTCHSCSDELRVDYTLICALHQSECRVQTDKYKLKLRSTELPRRLAKCHISFNVCLFFYGPSPSARLVTQSASLSTVASPSHEKRAAAADLIGCETWSWPERWQTSLWLRQLRRRGSCSTAMVTNLIPDPRGFDKHICQRAILTVCNKQSDKTVLQHMITSRHNLPMKRWRCSHSEQ